MSAHAASDGAEIAPPVSRGRQLGGVLRRGWLVLVLVAVFLTFGLPRFLSGGDSEPTGSHGGADIGKLCRDHGGTLATAPDPGTATAQRFCTVRYGGTVYRMDAITPAGFDADTARFQRQGCDEARRQEKELTGSGQPRRQFIYHPTTGVCEHRP